MSETPDLSHVRNIYCRYVEARNALLDELRLGSGRRSNRDPLSELSEWLVAALVGGTLADNRVQKDWDVLEPNNEHIQVKYLANSTEKNTDKWVNEHEIRVNDGMNRYALVIFVNLLPEKVIIFPVDGLEEVGKALGKKHGDLATTLQFTQRNYHSICEDKETFKKLGVDVYSLSDWSNENTTSSSS